MNTLYKYKLEHREDCPENIPGTPDAYFPFNAQEWQSYDGGKTFVYVGVGLFFKTEFAARLWIKLQEDEHRRVSQ